ncbi:restriction endonuclease subunit S [Acinetobacter sp. SH20PTE14]|uniref:restriction endonuclease subunit S n=1 Tax=Acinetobacter sp. SH20PTE14 TaxID=2905879 RepID=UPI001F3C6A6F|nr:restriction endonuclease subunit S [Acinetobacter sp. SH20PTE14]UIJ75048.1 restriction endonuclease subunit S [Acinetobacter sp. SH20PTE14]
MEKQKCPELRFEGFDDGWQEKALNEIFIPLPNNTLSRADLNYDNGDIKNIHYGDILVKYTAVLDYKKDKIPFITEGKISDFKSQFLRDGDVIFADTAEDESAGKAIEINGVDDNYIVSGLHTMAYRPRIKLSPYYLGHYLNSNAYHHQLLSLMQGIKVLSVSRTNIAKTIVKYPASEKEQAQIGELFQNLDQSIALHEKKLAQTQNFKQAMLEKMFPKQGGKRPEIRLKGFSRDWHSSKLSDYISIKHGFAFNGEFFSDKETDYCLLTPGNFMIGGGFKAEKFIYYKGEVPKNYILKENDLIVTMTDLSKESDTLGLPALLPSIAGKTLLHNQRLGFIIFENLELEKEFLFYLLQTKSYHKYIVLSATGTTVKHTSPSKILGFTCKIPEPTEQKKIGEFFQKIDEKINLHQQQLQTLKNLKQAFLEKMFV